MEDWVARALEKWPNVPHLYGWLKLDRRGRWLIKGEIISRPQIIDTINANYAADERGCWFFQNGPQRGYMALEYTPLILRTDGAERLITHNGLLVQKINAATLDEEGALLLQTEHGAGVLDDAALPWALERMRCGNQVLDEASLAAALTQASGMATTLQFLWGDPISIQRLDAADAPLTLGFVREPRPA